LKKAGRLKPSRLFSFSSLPFFKQALSSSHFFRYSWDVNIISLFRKELL